MSTPKTTIDMHSNPMAILRGTRLRLTRNARVASLYSSPYVSDVSPATNVIMGLTRVANRG